MARSYSLDLRERVFGAWQRGEGSQARDRRALWGERELRTRSVTALA